jgi:acyl-CoA oxidase
VSHVPWRVLFFRRIGSAAQCATHAAVFAQLLVPSEDGAVRRCGVSVFLVPLRDMRTGRLLPGVVSHDLGPKMGRNGLDNGLLSFSSLRVPRSALLSRYTKVNRDGTIIPSPLAQLAYAALVDGRALMAFASYATLTMALTIAVRYALRRRQFPLTSDPPPTLSKPVARLAAELEPHSAPGIPTAMAVDSLGASDVTGTGERPIMSYPLHLRRLVPLAGLAFCLRDAASLTSKLCVDAVEALQTRDDPSLLKQAHCVSAGLKAEATWMVLEGVDSCRQSCGGLGYSGWNGLSSLVSDFAVMPTWEGDNSIMMMQACRLLFSAIRSAATGSPVDPPVAFVTVDSTITLEDVSVAFSSASERPAAFLDAVATVLETAATRAAREVGMSVSEAEDRHSEAERECAGMIVAGRCWMRALLVRSGMRLIEQCRSDVTEWCDAAEGHRVSSAVSRAVVAFGGWVLEQSLQWVEGDGATIRRQVTDACVAVSDDLLGLVECWSHSDWVLGGSAIGASDGRPYERWIERVESHRTSSGETSYWSETVGAMLAGSKSGGPASSADLY